MEVAQFGDTEIEASSIKTTIDKLRQYNKDSNLNKLEEQFEVRFVYYSFSLLLD